MPPPVPPVPPPPVIAPPGLMPPLPPAPPAITAVEAVRRCVGGPGRRAARDVAVCFALSEPARVTLRLQRRIPRGRPFRWCPAPGPAVDPVGSVRYDDRISTAATRARRRARRAGGTRARGAARLPATRTVRASLQLGAGTHRLALLRTLGVRRLVPGRYRVVIEATSADGRRSEPALVYLRVLAD